MNLNTAPQATLQLLPTQLLRTLSAALPALVLTLTASTPAQAQTPDSGATSATLGVNLSLNSGWDLNWQYSDSYSANSNNAGRSAIDNNDSGEFKLGAKLSF